MADRILCSCITCPKCGTWIVVEREIRSRAKQGKFKTTCGVSEAGKNLSSKSARLGCLNYLPPSSSAVTFIGLKCGMRNCCVGSRLI
jgi:hypothetical protein